MLAPIVELLGKNRDVKLRGIALALIALCLLAGCAAPTAMPSASPTSLPTAIPQSTTPAATPLATIPSVAPPTIQTTASETPTHSLAPSALPPTATPRPPTATATRALPLQTPTALPTHTPEPWPYIRNIVVSSSEARTLYAAIGDKAYRSEDGGLNWVRLDMTGLDSEARIFSVALDYRNPNVLYATTSAGIYKSADGSAWSFIHPLQALTLAVDLVESDVLWAGVSWTTEYAATILKSTDAGRTWGKSDLGLQSYMGYAVTQIAIDPAAPNILYANLRYGGRFGWPNGWVYRGGRNGTWEPMQIGPPASGQFSNDACMPNGLAFDPNLRRLYVGCDAYYYNYNRLFLLASDNAHEADSSRVRWTEAASFGTIQLPYGLGGVRPLAVDAREPKSLYVLVSGSDPSIARPNRFLVSHDDAATWQDIPLTATQWTMPE